MIVASPRPIQAVSELPPLLRLGPDDILEQHKLSATPMGNGSTDTDSQSRSNDSSTPSDTAVCQNGVMHPSITPSAVPSSTLMSGETESPPPRYTRFSTTTFIFSHAAHPSTCSSSTVTGVHSASMSSSSCSTARARPSFESSTTPSDHGVSQGKQDREFQMVQQRRNGAVVQAQQRHPPSSSPRLQEELDNVPSYESSFRDTNLSGLPEEALTALSLARENLSDLQRASFLAGHDLDDLDRSDDRVDPDSIIQRRLTRNALLARQSAITLASTSTGSLYSQPETVISPSRNEVRTSSLLAPTQQQQRDSVYSTATTYDYDYDPLRVSVQTYGSSVLTYGSRASQLIDGGDHSHFANYGNSASGTGSRSGYSRSGSDEGRPVAPLPWLPRPSALDRIQHCGMKNINNGRARSESVGSDPNSNSGSGSASGRRPLPPLPTPISASGTKPSPTMLTRDRSVSLPSGTSPLVSDLKNTVRGPRRPRPLPRTPSATMSTNSNLPDILEGQACDVTDLKMGICGNGVPPSSGPMRSNSMFLSPTSAISTTPLNFRGRRSSSARYSTIGYGHAARAGIRGVFIRSGPENENEADETNAVRNSGLKPYARAASRASTRSARSTFLVPDVDELVRILDSMDDSPSFSSGTGSGSSSENCLATPLAWTSGARFSGKYGKNRKNMESRAARGRGDDRATEDDGEEEIDMGEALEYSRSVVNVPCGERHSAASTLKDLGFNISVGAISKSSKSNGNTSIGLPTPAATPRNSPHRQPTTLPGSSKNTSKSSETSPPPLPPFKASGTVLSPPPPSSQAQSPSLTPSDADAFSLTNFPLPPVVPLFIPEPKAVDASDMPIPSASSGMPPSPSLVDVGKSPAERAVLPGMSTSTSSVKNDKTNLIHSKHITAREAIADLKHRVAELPKFTFPAAVKSANGIMKKLPSGVPILGLPIPPRKRARSTSTSNTYGNGKSETNGTRKHALAIPPAIDVRAANALPPPTSYAGIGRITPGSSSAPPNNQVFDLEKPTIIYATPEVAPTTVPVPPVAPLKIKRTSSHIAQPVRAKVNGRVPMPQSADAVKTSFDISTNKEASDGRAQRATSFCVSPGATSSGAVAPLRLKTMKSISRARSSTVGAVPSAQQQKDQPKETSAPVVDRKSSETDGSEESESDHLATPTVLHAPLPDVVEAHTSEDDNENTARGHQHRTIGSTTGFSIFSSNNANSASSFSILHQSSTGAQTHISIDPAFADLIKSMAGASEEEQMGSLLTIASSINTEHHSSGYNAGFSVPVVDESRTRDDDGFVDVDDDDLNAKLLGYTGAGAPDGVQGRKETVRKSTVSGISTTSSTNERRKSKSRSISSMKKRHSTRSAAAVRAAIRALPDPNTFPIPAPDSGGSVATDLSAQAAGADFSRFGLRPSPLPKLRVVTKFKGGTVLLPASSAPLSASSTKSTMSTFGGHSRNASAVSVATAKRTSSTGGRKLNRLTLTDPRSPMNEAAVAAAQLVARVRQKRAALAASRNRPIGSTSPNVDKTHGQSNEQNDEQSVIHVITRGHARTGSGSSATQTLKSKLKMSGGSFFGGSAVSARNNSTRSNTNSPSPASAHQPPDVPVEQVKLDAQTSVDADVVIRSGPSVQRPTIRCVRRARTSVVPAKSIELDLGV